jgi:hypothetical protein
MKNGTISVMFSILLLALLIFLGVILDISRLIEAEYELNNALKLSSVSLLSGYDYELNNKFGIKALYINNNNEIKEMFKSNFKKNIETKNKFFNYNIKNIRIKSDNSLNDNEVLIKEIEKWNYDNTYNLKNSSKDYYIDNYLINVLNNRDLIYIYSGNYNFNIEKDFDYKYNINNFISEIEYSKKLKRYKQILIDNLSIRNNHSENELEKYKTKFNIKIKISVNLMFLPKKIIEKNYICES